MLDGLATLVAAPSRSRNSATGKLFAQGEEMICSGGHRLAAWPRMSAIARGLAMGISVTAVVACGDSSGPLPAARVSVAAANAEPGTSSWFVPVSQRAAQTQLALWASPYALRFGDTLDVYIHATRGPVAITVYRMGWYGGTGGHIVYQHSGIAATPQPACSQPFPGPVSCPWTRTLSIPVGNDWVSGIYLVKAVDQSNLAGYYPFVLTDLRPAAFVAVVPQFTWQAYNTYGGSSLYTSNQSEDSGEVSIRSFAHFVSFERPYAANGGATYILDDFKSHDLRDLRFLERNGYDVTYVSTVDLTEASRGVPSPVKGLLFIGHDEYWTYHERSNVDEMRSRHTHLAFFSGNNAYWNIRLTPGPVTARAAAVITCYKLDHDPDAVADSLVTTEFRMKPVDRPEDALTGIEYVVGTSSAPPQQLVVSDTAIGPEAAAFLAAAGLKAGDIIPSQIGIEGDRIIPDTSTPRNLQVLFKSRIQPKFFVPYQPYYYTTFYTAPSGAGVFTAGDVEWGRGLDGFNGTKESPPLQNLMKAVLDWMLAH